MTRAGTQTIVFLAVASGYFVAGKIGLLLAVVNESTTAVWPAAGIALASLLLCGMRLWPAVAVGAFLVNVTTSQDVLASLGIAAGNTLEAIVGAWATGRLARGRAAFERTADIIRFALLCVLGSTMIAATIGTGSLLATGLALPPDARAIWLTWWLGDAAGIMMATPVIILWSTPGRQPWTAARAVEALVLAGAMSITAAIIFGDTDLGHRHLQLQFLTIPLLLWAAFRFGGRETATLAAVLSLFASAGTRQGLGPFAGSSPNESLLLLQGFIGVITMVMLAVAAEVSGRSRVEAEIRALNEELEQRVASRTEELTRVHLRLLEAQQVAHIGSWEWNVETNSVWWSDELYRIYGVSPDVSVTYESFVSLLHPDDRASIENAVAAAARHGDPFAFDHRIVRPDGTVRVVHGEGRVLLNSSGRVVRMVGTGHDITEQAASRAKDEFLAVLSHELRTPLNVALGWTHLVRNEGSFDARSRRAVETIHRNLQMLTRLVADIMDVSRISARSLKLDLADVDVRELVQAALETVRQPAAARSITVDTDIAMSIPLVRGDGGRLQQVVWNLLSNAVKFARDGGRVTLSVSADQSAVQIRVEDDGPGIAPGFLPYIFDPFRQADSSSTRTHGGLGLGLSIARHLVQLHGGTITAENRAAGGAVFTVRLPVEVVGA